MDLNQHSVKATIHVFDVDGTIIKSDSFILLLNHFVPKTLGRMAMWMSVAKPLLLGFLKSDLSLAKLALLSHIWTGKRKEIIEANCADFFLHTLKKDIRPAALVYLLKLGEQQSKEKIVLLSASCKEWLQPLATLLGADLICTELRYDSEDIFLGRYATPNCKGDEKVRRLLAKYPAEKFEFICYGNTPSDKKLKQISKAFYYRYF